MADGTFVPAAVCQIPVLHYGWRYVFACSCVPSSFIQRAFALRVAPSWESRKQLYPCPQANGGLLTKMKYFKKS